MTGFVNLLQLVLPNQSDMRSPTFGEMNKLKFFSFIEYAMINVSFLLAHSENESFEHFRREF